MNEKKIRCTLCPIKCSVTAKYDKYGNFKKIYGASCPNGRNHIMNELDERAIFRGFVIIKSGENEIKIPVRTTRPISKDAFPYAEEILSKITPSLPITQGESIIIDFLERGVNLIADESAE